MAFDTYTDFDIRSDPLYQEGMIHFQSGAWDEAIRCFELLERTHPDDPLLQAALDEARFKISLDRSTRVRAKAWVLPHWLPVLGRLLLVAGIVAAGILGVRALLREVQPSLEAARIERQREALLDEAFTYLEAEDFNAAEELFQKVLVETPDNTDAQQALAYIEARRELEALYENGVSLQENGQLSEALDVFAEVNRRSPRYRDVTLRVETIQRQQGLEDLAFAADQSYKLGRTDEAIGLYEQLRAVNVRYETETVVNRLFELYMKKGRLLMTQDPPVLEDVPKALEFFTQALALKPRDSSALLEQKLARLFLEGQTYTYDRQWDAAVERLQEIYEQRPDYLGGIILNMLYEAYVRSGDQHRDAGDLHLAYEMYRKAEQLPVSDVAWARGRLAYVQPQLTPTPTPRPTATPRAGSGGPAVKPIPRLETLVNKIVFYSEANGYPEIWMMDPDGQKREPLGASWDLRLQFDQLVERHHYGSDGVTYAYVQDAWRDDLKEWRAQIFLVRPHDPQFGNLPPLQLTDIKGLAYDPVISPDGTRIAYVGQEVNRSDDVFVMRIDGTEQRRLTDNVWEWDKHPSWSPDSLRIVFWSNRTGIKQLWVMNADGGNPINISNTKWDEYDPIWVK